MLPIVIGIGALALLAAIALSGKKDERPVAMPKRRGKSDPNLTLKYARKWAPIFQVPVNYIMTIAHIESAHDPSRTGRLVGTRAGPSRAWGLMQQMDVFAAEKVGRIMGTWGHLPEVKATASKWRGDPRVLLDPDFNVMLGAWELGKLYRKFKDLPRVAAAYHGGEGVFKTGPGPKGRQYIARAESVAPLYRDVA